MNDLIEIKKELQVIKELLANNSKKVLNLNELADYIGFSKSYVYKLTSQNLIPHSKPNGKAVFFNELKYNHHLGHTIHHYTTSSLLIYQLMYLKKQSID